jgi:hypothetical protein
MSVLANGEESSTFKTGKGLRQGDSLSPLLFNLVADMLNKMLSRATQKQMVNGLLDDFRHGGILTLQYADDTLLFSAFDHSKIRNLKGVLMLFEKTSGMRINFHKGEVIPINLDENNAHGIAHILNCPIGKLPFKYLGVSPAF